MIPRRSARMPRERAGVGELRRRERYRKGKERNNGSDGNVRDVKMGGRGVGRKRLKRKGGEKDRLPARVVR